MPALGLAVTLAATGGNAAAAPPKPRERAAAVQKLADCRRLPADAERLACYDEAMAALDQAEAKGDIVVVDREQARAVRRQAFGFSLPSLSLFDRDGKPEPVDAVTLKVESATRGGDGKWLLRLEGGQVWRQIDASELSRQPRPGAVVTIRSALMGSYKLTVGDSAAAIRVHRDN
jgi:hypothetical protein